MSTITILFDVKSSAAQYDNVMKDLAAADATHPRGRLFHVAQPGHGVWLVIDVWESKEAFQEFGKTLLPILAKNGIPEPSLEILPTHNLLQPRAPRV
jgi:hypothetical protein